MASASIFVWRIRLCLVLTATGMFFINSGKDGAPRQEQMLIAASHVKCPPPASRNSAASPAAGSPGASPADRKPCAPLASAAVIRTSSNAQKFKPEIGSRALGALGTQ